jgi:glycosyltransferase involved in cell wall biosynthesis
MTMPPVISNDGPRILYTMMESSNELHKDYADRMNLASEIWVPTTHMSDLLDNSGVCSPVHIVPLGVNTDVFSEKSGRMTLPKNARGFRFLSVSWWGPRKGFDLLIKAFVNEFSSKDDVSLVISTKSQDNNKPAEKIASEIQAMIKATGKTDRAQIILHSKFTNEQELASLYNACDAFVLASRGEGFSLPICEAASCGLPVITTRCTAQATYLDDNNSYLVDPEGYERANPQDGRTSSVGRWCRYYENQPFPIFSGKSIKILGTLMRKAYEDRVDSDKKASVLQEKVRTTMTWENTVDKVIERLTAIEQNRRSK